MVKEWITREGQSLSLQAAKQLLAPVAIKGKMLHVGLMKELEKWNHSKRQRPEEFDCSDPASDVTVPKRQKMDEKSVNTMTWYNKTELQCQICSCVFPQINSFIEHINAIHQKSVEKYKLEFGRPTPNPINFQCQICEQILKCEEDLIKR